MAVKVIQCQIEVIRGQPIILTNLLDKYFSKIFVRQTSFEIEITSRVRFILEF